MRKEPDYFGDQELPLVYIAKKLKEALEIESLFAGGGIDYLVEPDSYTGGIIFRTERTGAFFYVAPEAEESARRLLRDNGYTPQEHLGN